MLLLFLAILLVILSLILSYLAARERQKTGIPAGKVIYVDASQWGRVEKPLFNPVLRLAGKPDYLVKTGGEVIPVEVKSRQSPRQPHDSHIYQLGAYCLLVEYEFGKRPSHGILHYSNKSFKIDYTREFEKKIKSLIHEIQVEESGKPPPRSHQDGRRCEHCGFHSSCDQSLGI